MQELNYKERTEGPKNWRYFLAEGTGVCLYTLHLEPGDRHVVYEPSTHDGLLDNEDDANELRTPTVIAPGGHVRIHSPAFDRPAEWLGGYEKVGGGIIFNAKFEYEGVLPSDWICVAPPMGSGFWDAYDLKRIVLEPGEEYTFTDNTVMAISMVGHEQGKAFTGDVGDQFVAAEKTLLCVWEKRDELQD